MAVSWWRGRRRRCLQSTIFFLCPLSTFSNSFFFYSTSTTQTTTTTTTKNMTLLGDAFEARPPRMQNLGEISVDSYKQDGRVPHRVDGVSYCHDDCMAGQDLTFDDCNHPVWRYGNCRDCGRDVRRCIENAQPVDGCDMANTKVWCKCLNGCPVWGGGEHESGKHCGEGYPRLCRVGDQLCRVGGRAVPGANSSSGCATDPDGRNFTRQVCDMEKQLIGTKCDALKCAVWCAKNMIGCEQTFKPSCELQKARIMLNDECDVDCDHSAPQYGLATFVLYVSMIGICRSFHASP